MGLKIYNKHCATVEMPLSTVSVTAGTCLSHSGDGYLSSAAITSAAPVVAVAAETKNGAATGRSALASTTATNDHLILAYPATTETRYLAVCSSTPTTTMFDVAWNVNVNGTIANETSTDPHFVIESIVDATAKTVVGRFVSAQYGPRVVVAPGS